MIKYLALTAPYRGVITISIIKIGEDTKKD